MHIKIGKRLDQRRQLINFLFYLVSLILFRISHYYSKQRKNAADSEGGNHLQSAVV